MTVDIAHLRALLAAATPGPYEASVDRFDDEEFVALVCDPSTDLLAKIGTEVVPYTRADDNAPWTADDSNRRDACCRAAKVSQAARDAELLAAAVNALPALLAIAEAAMLWRHGMVELTPGRFVDSDEGSFAMHMQREPARNALIAAVDAARKATP